MKQFKFLPTLGISVALLLSACGGGDQKTTDTATADSTKVDSTNTATSTVSTTPENIMVVWHKVADFAKWKASYEAHDSMKLSFGIHNYVIGRSVDDSNLILVATKADDMAKAKAFAKDPSLKTAMQKGGVIGAPSIYFNTMVYHDNATNMSDLRSMTMFTVKDWDAWQKAFEGSRQMRTDNGLTDRAYGHDADDNHKVVLVVAVNDSAKANAFWKSDALKQQRTASGVVGEVQRHVYRVVQKY